MLLIFQILNFNGALHACDRTVYVDTNDNIRNVNYLQLIQIDRTLIPPTSIIRIP